MDAAVSSEVRMKSMKEAATSALYSENRGKLSKAHRSSILKFGQKQKKQKRCQQDFSTWKCAVSQGDTLLRCLGEERGPCPPRAGSLRCSLFYPIGDADAKPSEHKVPGGISEIGSSFLQRWPDWQQFFSLWPDLAVTAQCTGSSGKSLSAPAYYVSTGKSLSSEPWFLVHDGSEISMPCNSQNRFEDMMICSKRQSIMKES